MVLAWLAVALVAVAVELIQLALPPHIPDLTDMLLGVAGASAGLLAVAWLARESPSSQSRVLGASQGEYEAGTYEAAAPAGQVPPA